MELFPSVRTETEWRFLTVKSGHRKGGGYRGICWSDRQWEYLANMISDYAAEYDPLDGLYFGSMGCGNYRTLIVQSSRN